ncbi:MAG: flagellar biosynthetic protein FliO [Gammaproteobacteria bacterium]|nr:flagellar biosynthetic protein FliO [Gammaproteobacteria bacterium]MCB1879451.1 flagellar biosynthetic protein FliO [Gammaproteobacteria bacterium]
MSMCLQRAWLLPAALLPSLSGAFAADKESTLQQVAPLSGSALTETAFGLIVIIALIFVLSWFFRRFGKQAFTGKGMVSVIGGVSLGPRERAVLLQVGDSRLLVGVAPGQVRMLHVLDRESGQVLPAGEFNGALQREMGGSS